jgi:hypothetical protein
MPDRIHSNGTGSTVPKWFAALYAMLAIIVLTNGPGRAAEDCSAAPNSDPPPGNHWYYRIQGAQQRHCWYLRPEGQKVHHADAKVQPTAGSAASMRTEAAGDLLMASPQLDPPLPPPRLATATSATAQAGVEQSAQGAGERTPFTVQRPDDRGQADGAGNRETGSASTLQDVIATNEVAWPVAVSKASPRAMMLTWVTLLVASALAIAGILHHAISRIVVARRRVLIERGRAGRIADVARAKMPPALAASHPNGPERAPIEKIDSQKIEERIRQILRAMEQLRAA